VATAPYQLWVDIAPISTAIRVSSTVTVTTASSHSVTTGAYIQMLGATGAAGTSLNGVYQVTATSGTTFTYTAAGSAGTATTSAAVLSYDLLNPPVNYATGTARQNAMIVPPGSIALSANGDGSGASMSVQVLQEATPAVGPWFKLVPDNARFRLVAKDTGTTPASDQSDVLHLASLGSVDAQLNGAGLGTESSVTLVDVNTLLDRVAVYGRTSTPKDIASAKRTSNVITLTTTTGHGFVVGQTIKVTSVTGGTTTFNTQGETVTAVTANTISYAGTGSNESSAKVNFDIARYQKTNNKVVLTPKAGNPAFKISSGDRIKVDIGGNGSITITGFASGGQFLRAMRGYFEGNDVVVSGSTIILTTSGWNGAAFGTVTSGYFTLIGQGVVSDPNILTTPMVTIAGTALEGTAIAQILGRVNAYHGSDLDYPLQRFINTTDTSKIVGGTSLISSGAIQFPSTSLRSALDTVVETYSGLDVKDRRYYVDPQGRLNFVLVDPTAVPTYATAPYAITTDAVGDPNTTTAKATINPFSLNVNYDHDTVKQAQFTIPAVSGRDVSQVKAYDEVLNADGTAYIATRAGAPLLESVVDYPAAVQTPSKQIDRAALAYFGERHKPMLSGQFTLRGDGTQAFNAIGFTNGYAQTGASTFALVSGWQPGQWVEVTSASLGLSGFYRVEQVDLSFEPGTYIAIITITFSRKNPNDVAALIARLGGK